MIVFFRCVCKASDRLLAAQYAEDGHEVVNLKFHPERRSEALKIAKEYDLKLPIMTDGVRAWEI